MSETIIDGTLLNTDNIKYSTPKANASGGKNVNIINKNTNSGLRISTPVMLTWGAKDFQDPVTGKGNGKFDMSLQFPSAEYKTEDTTLFLEKMEALEKKILTDALENSKAWFGKIIKSMDVLEALYTPFLKRTKDKFTGEPDLSKMPTLNVKLPIWEGVWKCEIYDEEGERLFPNSSTPLVTPIDYLQKGTNIGVLMQCGGIWFANGKFGVTWKLIQAMVQAPKPTLTGKCFYKLKPADKSKISSVQLTPASLVDEDTYVNDSEDDEAENVKEAQVLPDAVVKKAEAEVEVEEEPSVETSVFVTPVPEEIKKKKIIKKVSK
jgi:hypothetical protein